MKSRLSIVRAVAAVATRRLPRVPLPTIAIVIIVHMYSRVMAVICRLVLFILGPLRFYGLDGNYSYYGCCCCEEDVSYCYFAECC